MNLLQNYEKEHITHLIKNKEIPDFRAGDSVTVSIKISEGKNERIQKFSGVVIGRHNRGLGSTFRVRKMAFGGGVEYVFQLYSPNITIKVDKQGKVRRAKLYYLRNRTGKAARIVEKKRDKKTIN